MSFIHWQLRVGGVSKDDLLTRLAAARVELNEHARSLFEREEFETSGTDCRVEAVEITVAQLGLARGATFDALIVAAGAMGFSPCPLEWAPHFRLQHLDQAEGQAGHETTTQRAPPGSVTVVSLPSEDREEPQGFYLRRIHGVLWLRGYRSDAEHVWSPDDRILLALPNPPLDVRGTQGYGEQAAVLIERYESLPFTHKHEEVLHLLPAQPTTALDIGAGTGADAAWLAENGHRVLAVEPSEAFRQYGARAHAHASIEWLSDSLPLLERVASRGRRFGLVMLTAIWMHLDRDERAVAMPVLASLLASGGVLVVSVRHGPAPIGRVMFNVPTKETLALATASGLRCVFDALSESRLLANREAGITWSRLVFSSP